jgi:hypothetical protein
MAYKWFKFYFEDWLFSDTIDQSDFTSEGVFIHMLAVMTKNEGLPAKKDGRPDYRKWGQLAGRDARTIKNFHEKFPSTFQRGCDIDAETLRGCSEDAAATLRACTKFINLNFVKRNEMFELMKNPTKQTIDYRPETEEGGEVPPTADATKQKPSQKIKPVGSAGAPQAPPSPHDIRFGDSVPVSDAQVEQRRTAGRASAAKPQFDPNCKKCGGCGHHMKVERNPEDHGDIKFVSVECECKKEPG